MPYGRYCTLAVIGTGVPAGRLGVEGLRLPGEVHQAAEAVHVAVDCRPPERCTVPAAHRHDVRAQGAELLYRLHVPVGRRPVQRGGLVVGPLPDAAPELENHLDAEYSRNISVREGRFTLRGKVVWSSEDADRASASTRDRESRRTLDNQRKTP
eukprot:1185071-Prorocentrum_minimum.AAC.2